MEEREGPMYKRVAANVEILKCKESEKLSSTYKLGGLQIQRLLDLQHLTHIYLEDWSWNNTGDCRTIGYVSI